jgi:uncharacterized protein YgiM (DUF1202 family)
MARPLHSLLSVVFALAFVAPLFAQDVPPEIENASRSAVGEISADAVYIRSGAGDNYYPTMKLNTGAQVTVVGVKFDWLKVLPPEGSFCYVAKAFVDRAAGGGTGTVNRDDVNVRAGSALNAMKTTVQGKLSSGQTVRILGEQDEYYTIAPPADAYVYVKKDFVKFVKAMPAVAKNETKTEFKSETPTQPAEPKTETPIAQKDQKESAETPETPDNLIVAKAPSTQPTETPDAETAKGDVAHAPPSTQPAPAAATAEAEFDKLEASYQAASGKPIEQQPVAELLGGYQKLIANPQLPESMRRVADFRAQTLKARAEAREQLIAVLKQQEESKKRQQALKAEQQEIAQQIKKNDVQVFTAVGTLRTSSIQNGNVMLYRLTDPATGHTVCYIRAEDATKITPLMGKFIGVKGQLTTDPALSLKVVTPTDAAEVDPNQLFRGVASQLVPPSLVPTATAQPQQASATSGQ